MTKYIVGARKVPYLDPDKSGYSHNILFYFSMKTYVVGTHWKCIGHLKGFPMSIHNKYLQEETRKTSISLNCRAI